MKMPLPTFHVRCLQDILLVTLYTKIKFGSVDKVSGGTLKMIDFSIISNRED